MCNLRNRKNSIVLLLGLMGVFYSLSGQSFLSNGKWAQVEIKQSGLHRITYGELKSLGFQMDQMDPRNFQIFGAQGKELNQNNLSAIRSQSHEIPIQIIGESDGKWDLNDYILFYGQSANDWFFNGTSYQHFVNFYARSARFIIGSSSQAGKRIAISKPITGGITNTFSQSQYLAVHDSDIINLAEMGRQWYGEKFGNETTQRSFSHQIPADLDTIAVRFGFAIALQDDTGSLLVNANGIYRRTFLKPVNTGSESYYTIQFDMLVPVVSNRLNLQIKLNRPNTKSSVYLDYFEILGQRKNQITAACNSIIRNESLAANKLNVEYEFESNILNPAIWNVSDPLNPEIVNVSPKTSKLFSFYAASNQMKSDFLCFNPVGTDFLLVKGINSVPNQNVAFAGPYDLIIITHPDFLKAAEALKSLRMAENGLKVGVVTPQQVYNEFSGGQQDLVALRDYLRWQNYFSQNQGGKLKYVTLLGAASYDMQDRLANNTNYIPIFQSATYNGNGSYCLDDFLGYLDSNQGNPDVGEKCRLTVPIARIPCRKLTEALAVVEKIKRYSSAQSLGPWRTNIAFACDDADQGWETEFVVQSEKYARYINQFYPYLNVNRLYSDAFKQITTGNNEKYPDMSAAINRTIKDGALFMNYQGHGGIKGWAQESILDVPMINAWDNKYKMPIMFTATCEFSAYDDPKFQSAGVDALLNPNGGAVALMSTTRLVYVSGNTQINNDFWTNYGFPKPNEPIPTLGEVFQKMKNRPSFNSEDNKFALLGDASMPLAFPKHIIYVDTVQGKHISQFKDTIKAFSIVKIKGHIDERLIGKFTTFSGNMWVKIYDKPVVKYTLNNDNSATPVPFSEQSGILFNGQVQVVNGNFTVIFSVPKDINYNIGIGVAKFYAHNNQTDAAGSWQFFIGGSEQNITADFDGPVVRSFMQDTTFLSGGKVSKDVDFVARIFDKDGINATGAGIGRDILLVVDEGSDAMQTFVLNDYFAYDINSFKSGTVRFPLSSLTPGKHTFTCKAWDIFNNPGKGSVGCIVIPLRNFEVTDHGQFPQPWDGVGNITFWARHTLPGDNLQVNIKILDESGRAVVQMNRFIESSAAKTELMEWDGKTSNGQICGSGFYFFQIKLSTEDGLEQHFGGKFIRLQ